VYLEPVYVSQSQTGSSGAYPTLQAMLVYFDGQVGYGTTLQSALQHVFGTAPATTSPGTTPPPSSHPQSTNPTVLKFLQQAESYYSQAQAALKSGNFALYGTDLAQMKKALDEATAAAQGSGKTVTPSPSPSASP
jgi:uncharacterized protein